MNSKKTLVLLLLALLLTACGGQTPSTPVEPTKISFTEIPINTSTPEPTQTLSPSPTPTLNANSSSAMSVDGNKITFEEWGLSVELPTEEWSFLPEKSVKYPEVEGFVFLRQPGFVDSSGQEYQPTLGIFFYPIPDGTDLTVFSAALRQNMGQGFPEIKHMFGYEGSEPVLNIYGVGYFGTGQRWETYIIHAVNGNVGVQVSLEIGEAVLEQAKPEFYEIMQSLEFSE